MLKKVGNKQQSLEESPAQESSLDDKVKIDKQSAMAQENQQPQTK